MQRMRDCGVLGSKWEFMSYSFALKLRDHCGRGVRLIVRAGHNRILQWNVICYIWCGYCSHELADTKYAHSLHKIKILVSIEEWFILAIVGC